MTCPTRHPVWQHVSRSRSQPQCKMAHIDELMLAYLQQIATFPMKAVGWDAGDIE